MKLRCPTVEEFWIQVVALGVAPARSVQSKVRCRVSLEEGSQGAAAFLEYKVVSRRSPGSGLGVWHWCTVEPITLRDRDRHVTIKPGAKLRSWPAPNANLGFDEGDWEELRLPTKAKGQPPA